MLALQLPLMSEVYALVSPTQSLMMRVIILPLKRAALRG
jgi:hypothetical protein